MSDECMCPHCGKVFKINDCLKVRGDVEEFVVPTHDWPPPCRAVCPGSGQEPRMVSDSRPLGKDMFYDKCD